jgi:AMP-polyphosphate phosphotransferase
MFEAVEGAHKKINKETFKKREAKLRERLLETQYKILEAKEWPLVILINGVEGAGKADTVNLLTEWMDPRHIHAHAFAEPTGEELERPPMYRFWRKLPPKGKIGVFFGSWYTQPIVEHTLGDWKKKRFEAALDEIRRFETMLTREGVAFAKYWFHLSKKDQKKRFEDLEADKLTAWRVSKEDWRRHEHYDDFRRTSERALARTWSEDAPWTLVDGRDSEARALFVGESLLSIMHDRLKAASASERSLTKPKSKPSQATIKVDLSKTLPKKKYEKDLIKLQARLALLTRHKKFGRLSPVLVFEGADAAGKGGAIRRVTRALDARAYEVIPIAAPSEEERAQPYLWRFWRHAPRDGKVVIFDRSWYGRVLVERVENFCPQPDWRRAYNEINDFEEQLFEAGCPIAKFWLQISPEEQLRRFKEREDIAWKNFKITKEDWRNREKWDAYQNAAAEMIKLTTTKHAPWTVVPAEDKHYARIHILETICDTIERAL